MKCHCYKLHILVSFAKSVMVPIPAELPLSEGHMFDHLMDDLMVGTIKHTWMYDTGSTGRKETFTCSVTISH